MVFQHVVGGEILTFPDTPTTLGLSLWCFNCWTHVTSINIKKGRDRAAAPGRGASTRYLCLIGSGGAGPGAGG